MFLYFYIRQVDSTQDNKESVCFISTSVLQDMWIAIFPVTSPCTCKTDNMYNIRSDNNNNNNNKFICTQLINKVKNRNVLAVYGFLSRFVFFLLGKKEKPLQKTQSTKEIKAPPSPTLHLPDPVSSADLKEQDEEDKEFNRSSVIRRSFGLRGSKKGSKEKRASSVF